MLRQIALRFEGERTVSTRVRPQIGVRADVFFQHRRLLTSNATLFAHVFAASAATHIGVVFVRFEAT